MNKYTELSDFEINERVASHVLNGDYIASEEKQEVYLATMDGGDLLPIAYFDPCNNPADAMPIIIENGIGIIPFLTSTPIAFDSSEGIAIGATAENDNVYRAAMEVFLMMRDES